MKNFRIFIRCQNLTKFDLITTDDYKNFKRFLAGFYSFRLYDEALNTIRFYLVNVTQICGSDVQGSNLYERGPRFDRKPEPLT